MLGYFGGFEYLKKILYHIMLYFIVTKGVMFWHG